MQEFKQKILITGSTGFIGQKLILQLIKSHKTSDLLCIVSIPKTNLEMSGLALLNKLQINFVFLDLDDNSISSKFKFNSTSIYHLAATTDTSSDSYFTNDQGTINLISCLNLKVQPSIIYTGTTAIYCGRTSCIDKLDEISHYATSNEYGRSKLRAEFFLKELAVRNLIKLTIVRLPTVYGENPRINSLVDFCSRLVNSRSLLSRINWPGLTGLVYVDDVAFVLANIPNQKDPVSTFLLCSENITLQSILENIHRVNNRRYQPIIIPSFVWAIFKNLRPIIYMFEKVIPKTIYNLLWRFSLVVDNVIYCDGSKIVKLFPKRRFKFFSDMNSFKSV